MTDRTDWKAVADELTATIAGYQIGSGHESTAMQIRQESIDANQKTHWSEPFPVKEFRESGLLWFVNQMILWPVGVAIAVSVDKEGLEGAPGSYDSHLTLTQWAYPDGHRETIESPFAADEIEVEPGGMHPWARLLDWLGPRLALMPDTERAAAINRLQLVGIVEGTANVPPRAIWTDEEEAP